ncbi:MAG: hypothetical protein J5887_06440 [Erysipelotrichaceae bacterium]|nr:hypothetical protein [Erysipelotrichaceae bacterium]
MNKKTLIAVLAVIVLLLAAVMFTYYDATFLAPYDYKVSYLTVSDAQTRGEGFRILYMTDLEYGTYTDEANLKKIAGTVETLDYDLIVFGGDLFDEDYTPEGDDITLLTGFFRSLRSPQGKFAIFGDYDLISEGRRNITNKILSDAGFEIIEDSVRIHLTSSRSFSICGYSYNRQVDSALPADSLLIAVIHSLDLRSQLTDADLILCGNSHSRQLNWPFSGRYRLGYHGADKLYYSTGLGMSKTAHRLFCDPEIVIVTIK